MLLKPIRSPALPVRHTDVLPPLPQLIGGKVLRGQRHQQLGGEGAGQQVTSETLKHTQNKQNKRPMEGGNKRSFYIIRYNIG